MAMNDFAKLCVDTANHKVQTYSTEDANTAIRKEFYSLMNLDENCSRKELRRAIRKYKKEIFEKIEDSLEMLLNTSWANNDFFRQFVEEKNIAAGDMNEFYVPDPSLLTVSKFAGNHHDLIRQKLGAGETFPVPMSWYGVAIYADFESMMTKQIDWATFVQKLYEAMDRKIGDMVYQSFMDADKVLPTEYVKSGSVSKPDIIDLASEISGITGKEVAIVGTKSALSKLYEKFNTAWISEKMKDERSTTGVVGYVDGIRTILLPQVYEPGTRQPLVDNSKLLIVPIDDAFKPVKLVNGGEAYFNEVTDRETNVDMTVQAEYHQQFGVAVVLNMYYGMIKSFS